MEQTNNISNQEKKAAVAAQKENQINQIERLAGKYAESHEEFDATDAGNWVKEEVPESLMGDFLKSAKIAIRMKKPGFIKSLYEDGRRNAKKPNQQIDD